jgi:ribonuclease HI
MTFLIRNKCIFFKALNMTLNECHSSPHSSYSSNSFKASNRLSNKSTDDSNERPIVYTDGACERNGFEGAKGGIGVYWGEGHEDNLSEPLRGRQTNNRAEIQAAKRAIDQAKRRGYRKVTLRTDSDFLYKSQIHWKNKWKRNGWKTSNGSNVKNKEDFIELEEASHGIDINWVLN